MADLTEAEARLVLASAAEPGDAKVGRAVAEFGAVECVRQPMLLPPNVAARLDTSALRQLEVGEHFQWVIPSDPGWPVELDLLAEVRPLGLWFAGPEVAPLTSAAVAIVGSRSATQYGEYVAGEFAAGIAEAGHCIVSGGAYGIDAAAHRGALAVGGVTVSVLAGGVDVPYPRSNQLLFERIKETGWLVSESPLGLQPLRHRFLVRNRLIAAWGQVTVVVEARIRSGALATASHAALLGRDVLAVPGAITSAASAGCNQLIRDGAVLASSPADVLELVHGDLPRYAESAVQSDFGFG